MIKYDNEEFLEIQKLYERGAVIKSLKKQCNLIIEKDCDDNILLDFRKKLYSIYISKNNSINDDVVMMFKIAIEKCTLGNSKYNIPFIKKVIYYLEQKNNVDYYEVNYWLDLYPQDLLNNQVYGNNKYSDKEMYYLKKAKALDELNKIDLLDKLIEQYKLEKKQNDEILFFLKFHMCKLLFGCKLFQQAKIIHEELLLSKREKYVLMLPIKYRSYENEDSIIMYILEILLDGKVEDYLYAYIINWLKGSKYSKIVDDFLDYYSYENNSYKISDYNKLKSSIILKLCDIKNVSKNLANGKIEKITKTGNGFIKVNGNNYFVSKKYINKSLKIGYDINCFIIQKYNSEKKCLMKEAIIINRRYLDEILCSKKRK